MVGEREQEGRALQCWISTDLNSVRACFAGTVLNNSRVLSSGPLRRNANAKRVEGDVPVARLYAITDTLLDAFLPIRTPPSQSHSKASASATAPLILFGSQKAPLSLPSQQPRHSASLPVPAPLISALCSFGDAKRVTESADKTIRAALASPASPARARVRPLRGQ